MNTRQRNRIGSVRRAALVLVFILTSFMPLGLSARIGAFYSIPLYPLGASIDPSFVYSDLGSGTVADVFQVSGSGRFFGLHYNPALGLGAPLAWLVFRQGYSLP